MLVTCMLLLYCKEYIVTEAAHPIHLATVLLLNAPTDTLWMSGNYTLLNYVSYKTVSSIATPTHFEKRYYTKSTIVEITHF